MKAIQITVDQRWLARLDADPEVQEAGRSAVFRRAVDAYLRQRRKERIAEAYRRGYARGSKVEKEFEGWTEEGAWSDA
jgi:metal-responsive CopG/Arc/MetJ family transcriptional regulator